MTVAGYYLSVFSLFCRCIISVLNIQLCDVLFISLSHTHIIFTWHTQWLRTFICFHTQGQCVTSSNNAQNKYKNDTFKKFDVHEKWNFLQLNIKITSTLLLLLTWNPRHKTASQILVMPQPKLYFTNIICFKKAELYEFSVSQSLMSIDTVIFAEIMQPGIHIFFYDW